MQTMKKKTARRFGLALLFTLLLALCLSAAACADGGSAGYTVRFARNEKEYVLPGDSSVPLNEILDALGLAGEVTDARSSAPALFCAGRDSGGVWTVRALAPFDSVESLTVRIDGADCVVTVTDDYFDGKITSWDDLQLALQLGGETITLDADITGGPLVVAKTVTLDLNGHILSRGMTSAGADGYVVKISSGFSLTVTDSRPNTAHNGLEITGGIITGGKNTGDGGGIYIENGSLTMNGGTITGNSAGGNGGGVYLGVGGTAAFTMNGGTITGNSAGGNGGGAYVDMSSEFKISGNPSISGNLKSYDDNLLPDETSNVYLSSYFGTAYTVAIQVTGALDRSARIGVTSGTDPTESIPIPFTSDLGERGMAANFRSDKEAYCVRLNDDGEAILTPIADIATWAALQTALDAGGMVTLTQTITAGENDQMLDVRNGKTVVLDLNGYTIDRNLSEATDGGVVIRVGLNGGGDLTVMDTSEAGTGTITGGYNSRDDGAGGVVVMNGGSLTLESGKISGNKAAGTPGAGGVMVWADASFTMTGGEISGNEGLEGSTGGIGSAGALNLSGSPVIADNVRIDGEDRVPANLCLAPDAFVTVTDTLTNETPIGIIKMTNPTAEQPVPFTSGLYDSEQETPRGTAENFTSDDGDYVAVLNEAQECVLAVPLHIANNACCREGSVLITAGTEVLCEEPEYVLYNDEITLTVLTENGCILVPGSLTVTWTDEDERTQSVDLSEGGEAGTWTFTMPAHDVTISARIISTAFGEPDFNLPAETATIEESAFKGAAMTVVYVPDTCTSVGADAFKDCAELTQIRLPKDCAIGDGAFSGCASLIAVYAPADGTTQAWCAQAEILFIAEE